MEWGYESEMLFKCIQNVKYVSDVKLLEVSSPLDCGKDFWKKVYKKYANNKRELKEWIEFLVVNKLGLKLVTEKNWKQWFQECQKPNYERCRLIFLIRCIVIVTNICMNICIRI
jgi:hypothetical protein